MKQKDVSLFWARFWDEFGKSNVISGLLAIGVWAAIIYLAIAGLPIPEVLVGGGLSVVAFFFGSKAGVESERLRARLMGLETDGRDWREWLQSNRQ